MNKETTNSSQGLNGRYQPTRKLASGGMATVWLTEDIQTGKKVALKVLKSRYGLDKDLLALFQQEGDILASFDHPGVVRLVDRGVLPKGESDWLGPSGPAGERLYNTPYLVMEYIEGTSLGSFKKAWNFDDLRRVLLSVLDALDYSHRQGFVHCDLKPDNILVSRGRAVLIDFGVAHRIQREFKTGGRDMVLGTPAYMSPEQVLLNEEAFRPPSDLYSLGCSAWALATGKRPFAGRASELMARHLRGGLPAFNPTCGVPSGFETWLRTMTQLEPSDRFESASAAADALRAMGEVRVVRRLLGKQALWSKRSSRQRVGSWFTLPQMFERAQSGWEDPTVLGPQAGWDVPTVVRPQPGWDDPTVVRLHAGWGDTAG